MAGGLGRYPTEVKAIADELADLIGGENLPLAKRRLSEMGIEGLAKMSPADRGKAVKFLSQTPSQRERVLAKLEPKEVFTLVLQARYLALMGAKLMSIADRFEMVPGMGYRRAAEFSALEAIAAHLAPSMDEILPRSLELDW